MNTSTVVQKLWNYCNVLRDDGMIYGDYVEQLALTAAPLRAPAIRLQANGAAAAQSSALRNHASPQRERGKFRKMADERSRPPYLSPNGGNQPSPVPAGYDWQRLPLSLALPRKRERGFFWGDELFDHDRHTLEALGNRKGLR